MDKAKSDARAQRLAAALKENLARRKAQARERRSEEAEPSEPARDEGDLEPPA